MIDISAAERLLDFGARLRDPVRAREQLEGAVALHNVLEKEKVAYLADEVGMGKTLVALGALALFRHYNPRFRVLVIAPRENIQHKWMRELRGFVEHNIRYPDLRMKGIDHRPVRRLLECTGLLHLLREVALDPEQDVFMRMPSFSLGVGGRKGTIDPESVRGLREELTRELPWLSADVFDLRNKQAFKDNVARAVCCALPKYDLVIVDEAHNLKHGFQPNVAARNRVLALALGHPDGNPDARLFPGYGRRAARVLLLSATPVEDDYRQLWNQLHVFGRESPFTALQDAEADEEAQRSAAARIVIRRVTSIRVGGEERTKNLYRREWREGGVAAHDEPIAVKDPRQRLTVALVQKKVAELLSNERFNGSFQIGMLASFESFLQTAPLRVDDDAQVFDDAEQTEDSLEREGLDVSDVNRLAASHRERFGREMAHPKMDAVVAAMADAWKTGNKSLIFVRRIGSVKELKAKLDERYDEWLMNRLRAELPGAVQPRIELVFKRYREERAPDAGKPAAARFGPDEDPVMPESHDDGGKDTFFAWFFRGDGPRGVVSGATLRKRFTSQSSALSTFFDDNLVAEVLQTAPGGVVDAICAHLGVDRQVVRDRVRQASARFLSAAKKHASGDQFWAAQAAAIEWLAAAGTGEVRDRAGVVWKLRFEGTERPRHTDDPPEPMAWLEHRTFFTELRKRPELSQRLWPERADVTRWVDRFRERQLRGQLLGSAARLGHAFIDLYVMAIRRLGSLEQRSQELESDSNAVGRAEEFLDLLERQLGTPASQRGWLAFDELEAIAQNFDLIVDLNAPEVRERPLNETARIFGTLLGSQQPVAGMFGEVNRTQVKQFRMPGYPLVLVTTDLLQEGEDLHTFCSSVHHYGMAWAPSSMEQRIGRIDRVRSQTDRRLRALDRAPTGEELLQVHFPYLQDTIEVAQVRRVLWRMNDFLRMMHEGLVARSADDRLVDATRELARGMPAPPRLKEPLKTAFPVRPAQLSGEVKAPAVSEEEAEAVVARFLALKESLVDVRVAWAKEQPGRTSLLGTAWLGSRVQPFNLLLQHGGGKLIVRCVSPVGRISPGSSMAELERNASESKVRVGAIVDAEHASYDATAEDAVLLGERGSDAERVGQMLRRVVDSADRLERQHLPTQDGTLEQFHEELALEGRRGR